MIVSFIWCGEERGEVRGEEKELLSPFFLLLSFVEGRFEKKRSAAAAALGFRAVEPRCYLLQRLVLPNVPYRAFFSELIFRSIGVTIR